MKRALTLAEIDACRRIGRDEAGNRTTIALAEFDALCDTAALAAGLAFATWYCGCGHTNGVNLATCAACGRDPTGEYRGKPPV